MNLLLGREIKILLPNGEQHSARFAITELSDVIASHNEKTFSNSVGYPLDSEGGNINDRNYTGDPLAQAEVKLIAQKLRPEQLISTSRDESGSPIITPSGIVISGNNRIMSIKLASLEFPERYEQYKIFLMEELASFGISKDDFINKNFSQPVLVRVDYSVPIPSTADLAKFNKDYKKSKRPIDRAIELRKVLAQSERCTNIISEIIGNYETFSQFRANFNDEKKLRDTLIDCNIIIRQEMNNYWQDNGFTDAGMDLIENMLAGLALEPDAIMIADEPGVKSMRSVLLASLPAIIKNQSLPQKYQLLRDINDAVKLEGRIVASGLPFNDYIRQGKIFEEPISVSAAYMNRLIRQGRNAFKPSLERYNDSAENTLHGDMFGTTATPQQMFDVFIKNKVEKESAEQIEGYLNGGNKTIKETEQVTETPQQRLEKEWFEWLKKNPFASKGQEGKKKKQLHEKYIVPEPEKTLAEKIKELNFMLHMQHLIRNEFPMVAARGWKIPDYKRRYVLYYDNPQTDGTTSKKYLQNLGWTISYTDNTKWATKYNTLKEAMQMQKQMNERGSRMGKSAYGRDKFFIQEVELLADGGQMKQYTIPEAKPMVFMDVPGEQQAMALDFPAGTKLLPDNSSRQKTAPKIGQLGIYYSPNENNVSVQIKRSTDAYEFLMKHCYDAKTLSLQETFWMLLLNRNNRIIGYHELSKGGVHGTVVDPKIVAAIASEMLAPAVMISHNHPSGETKPSNEDIKLTKQLSEGLKLLDIKLLDHLVVSKYTYFSFADDGLIFKEGGNVKKLFDGALLRGPSHAEGGIPVHVSGSQAPVEMEGDEGVVNKRSMRMKKKIKVEGTPCEVVSKVNEMGGGVKFDCDTV